jgi:hypothetical protein
MINQDAGTGAGRRRLAYQRPIPVNADQRNSDNGSGVSVV